MNIDTCGWCESAPAFIIRPLRSPALIPYVSCAGDLPRAVDTLLLWQGIDEVAVEHA